MRGFFLIISTFATCISVDGLVKSLHENNAAMSAVNSGLAVVNLANVFLWLFLIATDER
jgi:hypothetical protein